MTEQEQRAAVIAEARTWLQTPWRHMGNVKGQAIDCAMLLVEAYVGAGVIARFDPRPYPRLWFMHRERERFLEWVVDGLKGTEIPISEAKPADVIVYKIGKCYSHGAILVDTNLVIHSYHKNRMVIYTETYDPGLSRQAPKAFNMFKARA